MYRGNGAGGWVTGTAEPVGSGWAGFTALASGGDFSGDGKPDVLARRADGALLLYRGNGASGWVTGAGEPIGSGWNGLSYITLVPASPPPAARPRPPAPPAPPAAPVPDGNISLTAGVRCTPPGGRLRVSLKVRRRAGRPAPRVRRVVFFVRGGPRRADRRRPYVVRLRLNRPAGSRGRVYARVLLPPRGRPQAPHEDGVAPLRDVRLGAQVGQHRQHAAVRVRRGGERELREDRGDVALDGAVGEEQPRGDGLVGAALGHLAEHACARAR